MYQDPTSASDEVALNRCQDLPPVALVTTVAPVGTQQILYVVATFDHLYAVNASDGMVRWCQQVQLTQEVIQKWSALHGMPYHPPPQLLFGTPRVTNGVVYVCASGYGNYTYAFNAVWRFRCSAGAGRDRV